MKAIAKSNFIEIGRNLAGSRFALFKDLHRLEDRGSLKFLHFNNQAKQIIEIATWESVTGIRQCKALKEWVDKEDGNEVANGLYILIKNVFDLRVMDVIKNRHIEHLLISCEELFELDIDEKYILNIQSALQKHLGEMKPIDKNFLGYVKRKLKEIKTDKNGNYNPEKMLDKPFKEIK